jgi:cytochrome c5
VGEHQDRTFVITFIGVIAVLVGITIALIILATSTGALVGDEEARQALQRERAEQRLQPVGAVRLSGEPMPAALQAAAPAEPLSPEQVVQNVCAGCHSAGVMGAPRTGDTAAWQQRMQKGLDTLVSNAINGIGGMPPKGGDPNLNEEQVREAVILMLKESGVSVQ